MSLAKLLKMDIGTTKIILVGVPEVTPFLDSDEKPYYVAKLKDPVKVYCSVDNGVTPFEAEELYIREEAINADGWKLVNDQKPEEGFYMEGWVADFSKGQQLALYQAESIKKWAKATRGSRRDEQREVINSKIKQMIDAKKAK